MLERKEYRVNVWEPLYPEAARECLISLKWDTDFLVLGCIGSSCLVGCRASCNGEQLFVCGVETWNVCVAQGLDLPGLFDAVESNRQRLQIEDYSLSQTTLEQVFVALAQQNAEQHHQ